MQPVSCLPNRSSIAQDYLTASGNAAITIDRNRHTFYSSDGGFSSTKPTAASKKDEAHLINNLTGSYLQSIHSGTNGVYPIRAERLPVSSKFVTNTRPSLIGPRPGAISGQPASPPTLCARASAQDVLQLERMHRQLEKLRNPGSFSLCQPTGRTPGLRQITDPRNLVLLRSSFAPNYLPLPTLLNSTRSPGSENTATSAGYQPHRFSAFSVPRFSFRETDTLPSSLLSSTWNTNVSIPTHSGMDSSTVVSYCARRLLVNDACVSPIPCTSISTSLCEISGVTESDASRNVVADPLPRLNMRYRNVKQYPKFNTRKNSGFERRLRHTGLILDAHVTLRLLRKMLQPFVNKAMNAVLQHYMQDYMDVAVRNIRENLGEDSVTEADLAKFRRSIMRRVALQYFESPKARNDGSPESSGSSVRELDHALVSSVTGESLARDPDLSSTYSNSPPSTSSEQNPQLKRHFNCSLSKTDSPADLKATGSSRCSSTLSSRRMSPPLSIPIPTSSQSVINQLSKTCDHINHLSLDASNATSPVESLSSASSGSTLGFFHSTSDRSGPPSPCHLIPATHNARRVHSRRGNYRIIGYPVEPTAGRARKRILVRWRPSRSETSVISARNPKRPRISRNSVQRANASLLGWQKKFPRRTHHMRSDDTSRSTQSPSLRGLPKLEFNSSTRFTLGSTANTWLGLGAARGRIYTKHPELFRYQCDSQDKSWLCKNLLLTGHGVKAYLMDADQVQYVGHALGNTDDCGLQTFVVPQWILNKIRASVSNNPRYSGTIVASSADHAFPSTNASTSLDQASEIPASILKPDNTSIPSSKSNDSRIVSSRCTRNGPRGSTVEGSMVRQIEPVSSVESLSSTNHLAPSHDSPHSPKPPRLQRFDCC